MGNVLVRRARSEDLGALLSLYQELADRRVAAAPSEGARAETSIVAILTDLARHLVVAILDEDLVGTADLLLVPNLTHRGRPWAIVENVIVTATARRKGVGRELMEHLIELARAAGCYKLQLLSGKERAQAHELYRGLGLDAVAEGLKIYFDE
jgi:GNAT superfamily N-acetyltransferase